MRGENPRFAPQRHHREEDPFAFGGGSASGGAAWGSFPPPNEPAFYGAQPQPSPPHRRSPRAPAFSPYGSLQQAPFPSPTGAGFGMNASNASPFDLSGSMSSLHLGGNSNHELLPPQQSPQASAARSPALSPFNGGGGFGAIGRGTPRTPSNSASPRVPSSPWGSSSFDSDRLRDQMNQQMAALYRSASDQGPSFEAGPPLATSGEALLGMLNGGGVEPHDPRDAAFSNAFAPVGGPSYHQRTAFPLHSPPSRPHHAPMMSSPPNPHHHGHQPLDISGETLLSLLQGNNGREEREPMHMMGPRSGGRYPRDSFGSEGGMGRPPQRGGYHGYDGPTLRRENSNGGGSSHNLLASSGSMGSSTAVVSPDVTKPNDTIKVQVSLLTEECRQGRVLLIGLFRVGQPTNEKPIFVKQVLFESKIHRQARHWNTRITFRAPRSPGEFEFRIFEELKPRHRNGLGGDFDQDNDKEGGSPQQHGYYSNATIVRSNRLKVAMDYSHFIEFLRNITEKFRQNRAKRDTGGILSNLLAFMRLIDQIETVFLHGQALFEDCISDLLSLVSLDEQEMARFPMTETIPSPIETFHGTIRNVLNSLQANPWIKEFVSLECWNQVEYYQQHLYCAVSGLYFRSPEHRAAYWRDQYRFEPPQRNEKEEAEILRSSFITEELTQWIYREAKGLIPDSEAFRRQRQAIYDIVCTHVVRKLDGGGLVDGVDLDVFGSSANDFGTSESDMDMCLVLRPEIVGNMTNEDKRRVLTQVVALLEARPDLFTEIDTTRLTARIPIIMFKMAETGIECDLCVENVLAQRNTSLLRAYANADERVRVLAFVLKQFVKRRRMNCAAESTLSSYGYLLMLIHFLQRQEPPILPVLQTLSPTWQDDQTAGEGDRSCGCTPSKAKCPPKSPHCRLTERLDQTDLPSVMSRSPASSAHDGNDSSSASLNAVVETYFYDPYAFPDAAAKLELLQRHGARNTASVGELFLGFLAYYGLEFDASRSVVSVRMGRELLKSEKKAHHQWKLHSRLSIEDPFETSYDVAHVLKGTRDKYIRQQFVRAYTLLTDAASSKGYSVDDVMHQVNEMVIELPFHTHKDQMLTPSTPVSTPSKPMMMMLGGFGSVDGVELSLFSTEGP
ncbi:hypothetical protein Poli38472_004812 [Pythium oligandrum]|uniref:PAP-associated domain-containing protein n=1 Tax=Pythium oligandrum TaxID=41045 RepID=A0A8K1FIH0_PYTOL|nr:hypothetical protein Poli38472_004812 [Pythium oligandrum]|eukprot:TMW59743.1 hypothetical protein Poli38472_004812 [Pythium oligandrum]